MDLKMLFVIVPIVFICVGLYIFEHNNNSVEKIVIIALLGAIASVGRVIFAGIPSVQPSSFIIIIAGITLGSLAGFSTGVICGLTSNLILGFGPFVIGQVFCWGLMGFMSGVLSKQLRNNKFLLVTYSFLWGFVFGFIMNINSLIFTGEAFTVEALILMCTLSFGFDLAHGVANAVLFLLVGDKFIKILFRVSKKYGISDISDY